jgi:integrase
MQSPPAGGFVVLTAIDQKFTISCMPRHREPYTLLKHPTKNGKVWYYRLADDPKRVPHSTGIRGTDHNRKYAVEYVEHLLKERRQAAAAGLTSTLWEYLDRFFVWDTCPRVARLRAEGKQISRRYVANRRLILEKWVKGDPGKIGDRPLAEIRRRDLLDLRARVLGAASASTANQVLGALKACFKEGVFREDLDRNPTAGIGLVAYEKAERGIFSAAELELLFPPDGRGPWASDLARTCFQVTASCGMRRGEVLALRVSGVHLAERRLRVERAWKDHHEEGDPKWGSKRTVPFLWQPERLKEQLKAYMLAAKRLQPDELVFCNTDGSRLGETWWKKNFEFAMGKLAKHLAEKKVLFDWKARRLSPHSFRHTLNTLLRAAGKDPAKIRAALGWTQESTQDGYTHWEPEHLEDLRLG